MRVLNAVRLGAGVVAAFATSLAAAATIVVTFPELNGAAIDSPFPQPPVTVGAQALSIPAGDRIVSARISGFWGTSAKPDSTAGVSVLLDGVEVARCEKPDPGCWLGDSGQRPWQHTFTASELPALNGGTATLTAVQTSDEFVRLGVSTLVIDTAPIPVIDPPVPPVIDPPVPPVIDPGPVSVVPTLSPLGLLALLAAMAIAGMVAVKRRRRRG
jgi:hypothetical protein